MEYQTEAYNERELVLDTRKQVLVFFGFLVICGCFFVVGYVFGKGAAQRTSTNYADVGAAVNLRMKDNPGSDAYSRMNETVGEPILPPSAIIEPPTAPPKNVSAVSDAAQAKVLIPPVSVETQSDTPKPQTKETPAKTVAAAAEKPAPSAKQTAAETANPSAKQTASAKTVYSVQVAAFRVRREAETKARELEAKGFEYRIELPLTPDDYYRLRIGRFATRAEAAVMAEQLKKSGFETMITESKGN